MNLILIDNNKSDITSEERPRQPAKSATTPKRTQSFRPRNDGVLNKNKDQLTGQTQ